MSYDEPDGDDGGGDRGRMVAIASFFAVHEAELARTKLISEGIAAVVWDAGTVNADPLLAVALRGVKVAVPERDAPRAKLLLDPLSETFGGKPRPAFRVRGTRGARGMLLGAAAGLLLALGLMRVAPGPLPFVAGFVVVALGRWWGDRQRADTCSACLAPLPTPDAPGIEECPSCARSLHGTIDDMNDRLAAEEALEGDIDWAAEQDDDDGDDDDAPDDDAISAPDVERERARDGEPE